MSLEIDFNPQFERALCLLEQGEKSVFITGKAGVGKSTLLNYFCKHAKNKPVILAPTGVAALNVRGQTIHSFFNFYIDVTAEKIAQKKVLPKKRALYQQLTTLIIDEMSMVRADLLDCIDEFLRLYGPVPGRPFGGVHMVFVGDLCQLPPVVSREEMAIFSSHYATPYFFSARVFKDFSFEVIELNKVYRQKESQFIDLLNRVRNNSLNLVDIEQINTRVDPEFAPSDREYFIHLTTTNQNADNINDACLRKLSGRLHGYKAEIVGDVGKEYYPTAAHLEFKIGAQIMMLNNDVRKRWVNGSVGKIEAVRDIDGEDVISVRFQHGERSVDVTRFEWEVIKFKLKDDAIEAESVGTFKQFPFRLAWAVTIHKSQGKTFDRVIIDVGTGTFASGQLYVALSRCTTFDGVILKTPIKRQHIFSDPRIHRFLQHCERSLSPVDMST